MEITCTDRDELDRLNKVFDDQEEELRGIVNSIKTVAPGCCIGNIALYSGNKMRSLYRRFNESGINYSDSLVNRAIELYFTYQFDNALYTMARYAKKLHDEFQDRGSERAIRNFTLNSPDIEEYKTICDEVYNFDLDKDVINVINFVLDNATILMGNVNDLITDYNKELETLGIEGRIEYKDDTQCLPEELLYFKSILDDIISQLPPDDMDFIETPEQQEIDIHKTIQKKKNEE